MFHYFRKAFAFIVSLFIAPAIVNSAPIPRGYVVDFHTHAFRRWNGTHGSTRVRMAHRLKLRA